jgi:hypothetical protein
MDRNTAGSSTTGRDRRDDKFVYADDFARKINKVTASERSASPTDCLIRRLWRGVEEPVLSGVEGTSAVLILPMLFGAFRPPKPDTRIYCDMHLMVTGTSFHQDRGGAARSRLGG